LLLRSGWRRWLCHGKMALTEVSSGDIVNHVTNNQTNSEEVAG